MRITGLNAEHPLGLRSRLWPLIGIFWCLLFWNLKLSIFDKWGYKSLVRIHLLITLIIIFYLCLFHHLLRHSSRRLVRVLSQSVSLKFILTWVLRLTEGHIQFLTIIIRSLITVIIIQLVLWTVIRCIIVDVVGAIAFFIARLFEVLS